jgi:hypothetical protein
MDVRHLCSVLEATLSPNNAARGAAEAELRKVRNAERTGAAFPLGGPHAQHTACCVAPSRS